MQKLIGVIIFVGLLGSGFKSIAAVPDLKTVAEKSNWMKTGRAVETERLCRAFAKKYPQRVKCAAYGKTPEGRTLFYMVVTGRQPKATDPVVWAQAGIHAGEIDGKDAGFQLIREILENTVKPDPLTGVKLVFIPIVNLNGHERFGKWNRPNQIGPEEMGWRTTSQNYNLNRDFVKADAPEMQALIRLWNKMDPLVSLDLHVTNGAQFQPEVGLVINPNTDHGTTALHQAGRTLEVELVEKLKSRGGLALPFYPTFEKDDNPMSGFARYVSSPRFSQGYWYNRNRIGVLVESHSWKNYATRVRIHRDTILSTLEITQKYGMEWVKAARALDRDSLAGQTVDLEFKNTEKSRLIDFPGYKFKIAKSEISGAEVIRYFPDQPTVWRVPFFEELIPKLSVSAPESGYYVSVAESELLKPKLELHGISYRVLKSVQSENLKAFRATKVKFSERPFEGRQTVTVEGTWKEEPVTLEIGSLFIPIRQAQARLILQLFEPEAADSFLSWGFLSRAFEQKEYMEAYVVEDVAREMLANDPAVRAEFEAKLKDPEFAKDPEKRFNFFYNKHPSRDARLNLYPVFKR